MPAGKRRRSSTVEKRRWWWTARKGVATGESSIASRGVAVRRGTRFFGIFGIFGSGGRGIRGEALPPAVAAGLPARAARRDERRLPRDAAPRAQGGAPDGARRAVRAQRRTAPQGLGGGHRQLRQGAAGLARR